MTLATFRFDYEYEIEYEYEFSNQIRVPHIINYHTNLIPNVYLCVSQQQERVTVRGIQLSRNSKVVLVLDFVVVVKSKGRYYTGPKNYMPVPVLLIMLYFILILKTEWVACTKCLSFHLLFYGVIKSDRPIHDSLASVLAIL